MSTIVFEVMIDSVYKVMVEQREFIGEFVSKDYERLVKYCIERDYKYDYKNYFNIPALCYDEEHSKEGFCF
mgnify:CR=1 FL=1